MVLFFGKSFSESEFSCYYLSSYPKPSTRPSMKFYTIVFCTFLLLQITFNPFQTMNAQNLPPDALLIQKTDDFSISGEGTAQNWNQTEWVELTQRRNHENVDGWSSKVKILYSDTGLYFLFHSDDEILNATFDSHFEELWREDVVEVFLWPDESQTVYFEYEISPLNYELPILVHNNEGAQSHWIPFEYSYKDDRKTIHKTSVEGGVKESGAEITAWRAEFFIPFELLRPLNNIFPEPGTQWRANFYRIDYDHGMTPWSWQPYETNFHDFKNFGTIVFE
jgi:hypothetical protein